MLSDHIHSFQIIMQSWKISCKFSKHWSHDVQLGSLYGKPVKIVGWEDLPAEPSSMSTCNYTLSCHCWAQCSWFSICNYSGIWLLTSYKGWVNLQRRQSLIVTTCKSLTVRLPESVRWSPGISIARSCWASSITDFAHHIVAKNNTTARWKLQRSLKPWRAPQYPQTKSNLTEVQICTRSPAVSTLELNPYLFDSRQELQTTLRDSVVLQHKPVDWRSSSGLDFILIHNIKLDFTPGPDWLLMFLQVLASKFRGSVVNLDVS